MSRLTCKYDRDNVLKDMCTFDRESNVEADDCLTCFEYCNNKDMNCEKCAIQKAFDKLAEYEELEEKGLLLKEEDVLKFYYCESLDKYLVGKRLDTMYYADITDMGDLHFFMSRYLPWGENTYPSEPKEIPFTEWLNGFTKQRELKEGIE